MKGKVSISTKTFLFRIGITFLALLTLHVLVTIYKQLHQASQVLNELAQSAMIPVDFEKENLNKQRNHFSLPSYATNEFVVKRPVENQGKFFGINIRSKTQKDKNIQTRFQESVFSYERRFYEAHRTVSPTSLEEMNWTPRSAEEYRKDKHDDNMKIQHAHEKASIFNRLQINQSKDKNTKHNVNNNSNNNKSSKILITAYRRSGSSFIGEMFNRNPRIFYLFEPIHPVEKVAGEGKYPLLYDAMVGQVLDVIYTCSFNKHPFLVNFLSKSAFRLKSEALKSPGLCELNATPQNMTRECKTLDATMLERLCNWKDDTVVKTIRTSIKMILEYFSNAQSGSKPYELNLIHLVRDPRAIISSRLYLFIHDKINNSTFPLRNDKNLTNALRRSVRVASANVCSRIQSDLKYGRLISSNRYMLLRFEDAAMRPLQIYGKISKFSGIPKSEVVQDWLKKNTRGTDTHGRNDDYSTSRNSTASVHLWRKRMPYTLVAEVQSQCAEVMKMLGYLPAKNERDLMDVKKSLVSFDKTD